MKMEEEGRCAAGDGDHADDEKKSSTVVGDVTGKEECASEMMEVLTQGDAVEEFLAGDSKGDAGDDDLEIPHVDEELDGIDFKSGKNVIEYGALEEDVLEKPLNGSDSLNKMHVMEDVREGCDEQPSSPGHADQRTDMNETNENSHSSNEDQNGSSKVVCKIEFEEVTKSYSQDESEVSIKEEPMSDSSPKRKNQSDDAPAKKAKNDLEQDYYLRNKFLTDFTNSLDMTNFEQIQTQTEQLMSEIQSLNELAKEKEREWNQIVHTKKLKEELLLRIQRQKQVCLLSNGLEISESDPSEQRTTPINGDHSRQKFAMQRRRQELNKQQKLLKSLQTTLEINGHDAKNKQRPVRDVQSIIADYRQQHPETVPRRGRRIRPSMNGQGDGKGSVLNFSNMALGSGSQVRQNLNAAGIDSNSELGLLLSAMESASSELGMPSSTEHHETTSFKDILVQFAKLSQSDKQELLQNTMKAPPPYPEVTVHPVSTTTPPTNSLLHGILTKNQSKDTKSAFSPTLARLLTAPERSIATQQNASPPSNNKSTTTASNVSISDILSTNKARSEITITPVGPDENSPRQKSNQTEEEEAEDSVDRLVIDESGEIIDPKTEANSDAGDEVPQCQGCNQKSAQFVCAGCGNQWYCSRECQVSAWDEHSEVCSG